MRNAAIHASALLAVLLLGTPTGAQTISATDPEGIVAALEDLGYSAELQTDDQDEPLIASSIAGLDYDIFFYGCEQPRTCKYLLFSVGFDLPDGMGLDAINAWNRRELFGRAFLDEEGDPILDQFVTTAGGLTRENFDDVIDWWRLSLSEFKEHIGW